LRAAIVWALNVTLLLALAVRAKRWETLQNVVVRMGDALVAGNFARVFQNVSGSERCCCRAVLLADDRCCLLCCVLVQLFGHTFSDGATGLGGLIAAVIAMFQASPRCLSLPQPVC
jgi:hypothetical protein